MAIIYTYPIKSSPTANDSLLISDVEDKNRTKRVVISDIQSLISGIFGGGLAGTIPLWMSTNVIGDSIMVEDSVNKTIQVGVNNSGQQTVLGAGSVSTEGIVSEQVTVNANLSMLGAVKDNTDSLGSLGQVLVATAASKLVWANALTPVTGTGTPNTLTQWNSAGTGIEDSTISKITDSIKVSDSLMIGASNTITGAFSQAKFASGESNTVSGDVSIAIGFNNSVTGIRGGALGANNIVTGAQTWVIGEGNDAGVAAANEGDNNIVSGQGNTVRSGTSGVIGKDNNITSTTANNRNFILGFSNTFNDVSDSIAVGGINTINDNKSYIFGEGNTTSQNDTYAVGKNNTLSSEDDYAFGLNNTLSGSANIAMALGHENVLSGSQSYAFGRLLKDGGEDNTVIIGRFNAIPTATGRIVFGTGFSEAGRKNSIEIQAGTNDQSGVLFPAVRLSATYNDDFEAAAAGVEEGELYRANNEIRINLNLGAQDARNSEGFKILTPQVLAFTNGSSTFAGKLFNLYSATYTGTAGTATLNLATAPEMVNRKISIVTDSSFNGTTFTIQVLNGQGTIDGQSSISITGQYQSVSLWSNGTEWFTLK